MEQLPLDRALASVLAAQLDGASRPELLALLVDEDGAEAREPDRQAGPAAGRSNTAISCSDQMTSRRPA